MTVTHRSKSKEPDEIFAVIEPEFLVSCDICNRDLTHSIRIKCADLACTTGEARAGFDICPLCFCAGKEKGHHKREHPYRVVELHSYPLFVEDWGADEELLMVEGTSVKGLGNWQAIAEHIGTRTKDEVEQHYNSVYIDSPNWPIPCMDLEFDIDPMAFQERKRRRIALIDTAPPPPKVAPVSLPAVHEIASYLPGRVEFEHELENEAEDIVKDMEFGIVDQWGGEEIVEDENDDDVKARKQWLDEKREGKMKIDVDVKPKLNGINGFHHHSSSGTPVPTESSPAPERHESLLKDDPDGEDAAVEETQPPPLESPESLEFKLMLMEMYAEKVEKREEGKEFIFTRGLLEFKKMQALEKKRAKEEKDIIHRLRPFARLQTAEDFEVFSTDMLYEAILRKRVQELQMYRRIGLVTPADIEKYEIDLLKRTNAKQNMSRDYSTQERVAQLRAGSVNGRGSAGPDPRRTSLTLWADDENKDGVDNEGTPKLPSQVSAQAPPSALVTRKFAAPLNLANSPSLHLLTAAEQTLCSQLRILPKPYLVIKETLVREYARRGGKLRRREARDLVKIDVNKTSKVWDFLVQAGFLTVGADTSSFAGASGGTASPLKETTAGAASPAPYTNGNTSSASHPPVFNPPPNPAPMPQFNPLPNPAPIPSLPLHSNLS